MSEEDTTATTYPYNMINENDRPRIPGFKIPFKLFLRIAVPARTIIKKPANTMRPYTDGYIPSIKEYMPQMNSIILQIFILNDFNFPAPLIPFNTP